jgi:NADH-quinone oxidoreductase subunit N
LAVSPLIVIASTIVVHVVVLSVKRNLNFVFFLTLAGILGCLTALLLLSPTVPLAGGVLFVTDSFAVFFGTLMCASTFAVAVLSRDYLKPGTVRAEEYYVLLLGGLLGALALVFTRHFIGFFLGLEVLSISLYCLIGYQRGRRTDTEGALKYLILSGVSSAFLLFGMAVIYGLAGTMDFGRLALWPDGLARNPYPAVLGLVMVIIAIGFKLGVAPFHMWTPDVYEGAPAPVTAFIATVSKGSVFALLLRFLGQTDLLGQSSLFLVFTGVSVASMIAGNLLALFQTNVKRLLAYSSIAHFGYLLVPLLSDDPARLKAAAYYLVAYFVTMIGALGVVTTLSTEEREAGSIEDFRGLFKHRPRLAGFFSLMLLSLAGMPLTAGFIAKIYAIAAGTAAGLWVLLLSLIVTSAASLFYYLRVIYVMLERISVPRISRASRLPVKNAVVLTVLAILLIWWGVYPVQLMRLIESISIGQ